jgi:hypothetical protein
VGPGASLVRDHVEQELSRDRSQRLAAEHVGINFTIADDLLAHLLPAGPTSTRSSTTTSESTSGDLDERPRRTVALRRPGGMATRQRPVSPWSW